MIAALDHFQRPRGFDEYLPAMAGFALQEKASQGDRIDFSSLARQGGAVALVEFHYQSAHAISVQRDGQGISRREFFAESFEMSLTVAGDPEAARGLFDKLMAEFTPDKVSDRIVDFAMRGQDPSTTLASFREFILKAVEAGYRAALDVLGDRAEPVTGTLEDTLRMVMEKLQALLPEGDVEGAPPEQAVFA